MEKFFTDYTLKQESVHVWIVDEAFHNLDATPIVSRIQGCPCEFCWEYMNEIKKMEDASTEVGTGNDSVSSLQKNGMGPHIEKLLALNQKAESRL